MKKEVTLTEREARVAELLAWGVSKKEIADMLCVSESTVRKDSERVYRKIEIQKVTELCLWWFCEKCGMSWKNDPLKRFLGIALVMLVMCHDVVDGCSFQRARIGCRRGKEDTIELIDMDNLPSY
jgi:DNA-binding CsgD family transcriptional regulator